MLTVRDKPLEQLALACGGVSITQSCSSTWISCCRICCNQAETLGLRRVKFSLLAGKSNHIVFAAFLGLIFGKKRPGSLFSQTTGAHVTCGREGLFSIQLPRSLKWELQRKASTRAIIAASLPVPTWQCQPNPYSLTSSQCL